MMKKKFLASLAAFACSAFCAVSFAACGDDTPAHTHDYGTDWITSETHHWRECKNNGCNQKEKDKAAHADGNGDGKCDECGYTMNAPVDYTVTEAEWNEALKYRYKNLTYTIKNSMTGSEGYNSELTAQFTEDGSFHQSESFGWGERFYRVNDDETVTHYYHVSSNDPIRYPPDAWFYSTITTIDEYENGHYGDDIGALDFYIENILIYGEFTFNESENAYHKTVPQGALGHPESPACEFTVAFENGKVTSIVMTSAATTEEGEITSVSSYTFYDYGTTVINFPTDATKFD